eukprot:15328766-Alexandrium_andersonii.AAC.1
MSASLVGSEMCIRDRLFGQVAPGLASGTNYAPHRVTPVVGRSELQSPCTSEPSSGVPRATSGTHGRGNPHAAHP